ncbi:hypothetical protein [Bradyrhizobium sp. NAS80.1]|uniref:hypothetical protein n=1 Tax=Bradyrhizobium sp. NAS80.1 TaxID=1680159 RepID=UPI00143D8E87|nr:hypothetical protein [Bradyrhizobium sp. NAS80.1]
MIANTIQLPPSGANVGTITSTLCNVQPDASATVTPGGGTVSLTTTAPGQNMSLTYSGASGQRVSFLTEASGKFARECDEYDITILKARWNDEAL